MLPLPGLVSETPLETGQSRGQMDTFPTQLHSQLLHIPYAHKLLALLAVHRTNRHCPGLMKTG